MIVEKLRYVRGVFADIFEPNGHPDSYCDRSALVPAAPRISADAPGTLNPGTPRNADPISMTVPVRAPLLERAGSGPLSARAGVRQDREPRVVCADESSRHAQGWPADGGGLGP
jgi:hypothetical protein